MENTNFSLSGQEAQKLNAGNKIGIALFVIGIMGLLELAGASMYTQKPIESVFMSESIIILSFAFMLIGVFLFSKKHLNVGLRNIYFKSTNGIQKTGLLIGALGFGVIAAAWMGVRLQPETLYLWLSMSMMGAGILLYTYGTYAGHTAGIKNNNVMFNSLSNSGILGWIAGIALTLFYVQLYWFADTLEGLIRLFDPIAYLFTGGAADQWFVYGTLYTFLILFLGFKFIIKYRHNRYQIIRTISVMVFQLVFAYTLPKILESFVEFQGYFDLDMKNVWPLNYEFASASRLDAMAKSGVSGTFYFFWGIILFLVVTPVLTYYVGKRWYCSWVCGCGGLAETAGDSFRHLSSKTESSWKIERWLINSIMVFVLLMTVGSLWPYFSGKEFTIGIASITRTSFYLFVLLVLIAFTTFFFLRYRKFNNKYLLIASIVTALVAVLISLGYFLDLKNIFFLESKSLKKVYGFLVGAAFAGVIGVGFYPLLGNRVWCRFGCPMAGYMGLFQRFKSRFRITTNGSQCISCGNCSTYCEQGIDVRAYAQKGENIVRSSCVGCGVCSAVCPRGVLKLENGPEEGRFEPNPLIVTKDGVKLNM